MPKKDEWVSAPKALEILKRVNERDIHPKYLHILWKSSRLERRPIDGRTFEYRVSDLEGLHITAKKGAGRKRQSLEG